jgi:thiol-disulfide isomerase/thioredoxin
MKKINKTLFLFLFLFLSFLSAGKVLAVNDVNLYLFWGEGCPHCDREKIYLNEIKDDYPNLKIHAFEVYKSPKNQVYFKKTAEVLRENASGVPFTVIGDEAFVGFNESITPRQIEERIEFCSENQCDDSIAAIVFEDKTGPPLVLAPQEVATKSQEATYSSPIELEETALPLVLASPMPSPAPEKESPIPDSISFPVLGEIQTKNLSLPAFTIVIAGLDGFNPCAMWVLIFLITLLLGIHSRIKRWLLGTTFIVASALVYFIFMAAWLNIILFIGYVFWVRLIIGGVAIAGGAYNLKEYFTNKENACKVTDGGRRQAIFARLKEIALERNILVAMVGIILLAFAVNLVELVCSAGLPVVFTQVLALSDLPTWQYYGYMFLYILVFMADDLFVFFTAMLTLEVTGISTKYVRLSHLIGGILMLILGAILILKPEILMFG